MPSTTASRQHLPFGTASGGLSNLGGSGFTLGLFPFSIPPSTQSLISSTCSCDSP